MSHPSHLQAYLDAARKMPEASRKIFDALYCQGRDAAEAARSLGLTREQFDEQHSAMLRTLRGTFAVQ